MKHYLFLLFLISFGLYACEDAPKEKNRQSTEQVKESLMHVNKALVKSDDEKIRKYMERHNLKMLETGTGLRYQIAGGGSGENARPGQYATIDFKIKLLDGTVCYSSEDTGPQEFLINQDHVESGLHEGITFMKKGQGAIFIMPPHLAHGLIGDENKIPARATIVYEIELLNLR